VTPMVEEKMTKQRILATLRSFALPSVASNLHSASRRHAKLLSIWPPHRRIFALEIMYVMRSLSKSGGVL